MVEVEVGQVRNGERSWEGQGWDGEWNCQYRKDIKIGKINPSNEEEIEKEIGKAKAEMKNEIASIVRILRLGRSIQVLKKNYQQYLCVHRSCVHCACFCFCLDTLPMVRMATELP